MEIVPQCRRCHDPLTDANWSKGLRGTKHRICRACNKSSGLAHYYQNREERLEKMAAYLVRLRTPVLEAYGNKCACCGEATPEFLTIDHIANDGKAHRDAMKGGTMALYRFLRDRGYPREGFQLLCWNCNCAKYQHGECPHVTERREAAEKAKD